MFTTQVNFKKPCLGNFAPKSKETKIFILHEDNKALFGTLRFLQCDLPQMFIITMQRRKLSCYKCNPGSLTRGTIVSSTRM